MPETFRRLRFGMAEPCLYERRVSGESGTAMRILNRLATGVVAISLAILPKIADACPNCFAASGRKVLNTYYLTALMLGLLPMGMVGAFVGWFVRQSRRRNDP